MSRIVLASSDEALETRIRDAFGGSLNGELRRWIDDLEQGEPADLLADLTNDGPDVVAIGGDVEIGAALRVARMLDRDRPEIDVLLLTKPTQKLWEAAMKAGVKAIVPPDAGDDELREELERALEAADRRREILSSENALSTREHRVITVIAPKGGAGKSVMATNLAAGLAAAHPGRVVIVDLDLQFGDVAGGLQLAPEKTIVDAARAQAHDLTSLKTFLTSHPLNFYALCASSVPSDADEVTPEAVTRMVALLAEEFRFVIVDTPAGIADHALAVFDVTTDFVLVGNMDVPAVRALRQEIDVLSALGLDKARRHFVLNRSDSRVGLDQHDIEATVGMHVDVAVPSSRSVPLTFNQGTPIVTADERSPVSKAVMELVARFTSVPHAKEGPRGFLRMRRNGR